MTQDHQFQLHLIKPITGAHVFLPYGGKACMKAILCRTPDYTNGFLAFVMDRLGYLVFAKTGATYWTDMSRFCYSYVDMVLYKGKVCALSSYGLSFWDVIVGSYFGMERIFELEICTYFRWFPRNLIEWKGELLLLITDVRSLPTLEDCVPTHVELYKFNLRGRCIVCRRQLFTCHANFQS